jgi:hypothetical protein|tara:strand:- start:661 stop:1038 length:378 start_codon:yes stop_codon:yes gene_type:complete
MKVQADLNKQVFDKKKFEDTIDTGFNQLSTGEDLGFFDINLATLEDFWLLYERFFYDIPKEGEINSHEYLTKESGAYANSDAINDEVQVLLDEIAELRAENLELRAADLNQQLTSAGADPISLTN